MIKATVKEENSEGGVGVELQFKGTTTEALYEHAMLTLALPSRLTSRTKDPIERDRMMLRMLRMLDALGAAVAMLIADGAYKDAYCKVVESESVVIDNATISRARNKEGEE